MICRDSNRKNAIPYSSKKLARIIAFFIRDDNSRFSDTEKTHEEQCTMRIGVIGINHKLADLKLREQLAKACQKHFGIIRALHDDHHFVLLSTCNRTEVYFSSDDLAVTHSYLLNVLRSEVIDEEFDHKLYSYFGGDCFCHLCRVTSGLDSAILGETEIQGQVKMAYELASEYHALPKELHFLFQKSLGISKKVRSELQLGRGMPNLEHAILQTGKQMFSCPENTRLLFVGASEINQKILGFLKFKNFQKMTICNRSNELSEDFSKTYGVEFLAWEQLKEWHQFDWIIFGTKSPEYLIKKGEIAHQSISQMLVMDLCVPRNVDPRIGHHPGITLLNVDQINQLLRTRYNCMNHIVAEAEHRIAQAAHQHAIRYLQKSHSKIALFAG